EAVGDAKTSAAFFAPGLPGVVALGCTRGIFESRDGGRTWLAASDGIIRPRVTAIAPLPDGTWLTATDAVGMFRRPRAGAAWRPSSRGLATPSGLCLLVLDDEQLL